MSATDTTPVVKIEVGTIYQKIILLSEMIGQISDGQWENANPTNHYKEFMGISWENVAVVDNPRGPLTFTPRRNYAFNNKQLLDCVGDRIIFLLNLYSLATDKVAMEQYLSEVDHGEVYRIYDYESYQRAASGGTDDYTKKLHESLLRLQAAGITDELAKIASNGSPIDRKFMTNQCTQLQRLVNDKSEPNRWWKTRHGVPQDMTISEWNEQNRHAAKAARKANKEARKADPAMQKTLQAAAATLKAQILDKAAGLTDDQLAEKLGTNRTTVLSLKALVANAA